MTFGKSRAPLLLAALLAFASLAAPTESLAGPAKKPAPTLLDRAKAGWNSMVKNVKSFGHKLIDWGNAAIDWTKKKWANSHILKNLYGSLRGSPIIKWISKTGKEVVRRLERSAASMIGRPVVTRDVPPFLQKLAAWRLKRGQR